MLLHRIRLYLKEKQIKQVAGQLRSLPSQNTLTRVQKFYTSNPTRKLLGKQNIRQFALSVAAKRVIYLLLPVQIVKVDSVA